MVAAVANANTAFFTSEPSHFSRNLNRQSGQWFRFTSIERTSPVRAIMSERCQFLPPARPPVRATLLRRECRASALRHPLPVALMLVALGDRTGRVPGSLDALGLLADLARGRAERVDADLAV